MNTEVAKDWYRVIPVDDRISLIRELHVAPWLRCNMWHVRGRTHDLLIDSGMGLRPLKQEIAALAERPVTVISTHCHFDHIGGAHEFDKHLGHQCEANVYENPNEANADGINIFVRAETITAQPYDGFKAEDFTLTPAPLTGFLDEGDIVDLGDWSFNVFHMPGHSPGSIALFDQASGTLFSGDIIYDGLLIDSDIAAEQEQYLESMRRLRTLKPSVIHGGHFKSFGAERMRELIDQFLDGGGRMGDIEAWVSNRVSET